MARQTQQLRSNQRHARPGAEGPTGSPIHGAYLFSVFRIDSEPRAPATGAHDHPALALGARISSRRAGFTLVELLVVIAIIAILMSVLIVAAVSATDEAKRKETHTVMQLLDMAIAQFKDEAPLKRVTDYRKRYGDYPCDELEPFVRGGTGIPGSVNNFVVGPGTASTVNMGGGGLVGIPNREIAAMALVINLYSQDAAVTLDQIGSRYRRPPANPADFFDRNGDGTLDTDDEPLIYFVDAWGTPFDYFSVNTLPPPATQFPATGPAARDRLEASRALIAANRGKPLLVSYGATGPEKRAVMGGTPRGPSPLVIDYSDDAQFNNALNHDNVYLDTSLKDRILAEDETN
ncbi:MAG: type II secretion system protein [Phycisphaerae bacterium]